MDGKPIGASRRDRIVGYALGMIHESAWILGLSALAFLMSVVAKVIWP
jgi:hypothetical protein